MNILKRFLTPPVFADAEKTEQAYLLHVILWTLICVPILYLVFVVATGGADLARAVVQTAFGETVNILLLFMLHRGYVRVASIIQVSMFWVFFTLTAMTGSGVQGEAYLLGYALVISIAGILLGVAGTAIFTVLSLAAGGLMISTHMVDTLNPGFESSPLTTWLVSLLLFPVSAVLQHLASRSIRNAATRARASEERWRNIIENAEEIIYTFSNEGAFLFISPAWTRLLGHDTSEVVSKTFAEFLHPEDTEVGVQALGNLITSGLPQHGVEYRVKHKDGTWRWHTSVIAPVKDEDGVVRYNVGIAQDITERKLAETTLRSERDLLQTFLDNIPDTVYFKDLHSRFLRVNQAQARFLQLADPQQAIGKSDLDFQPAELAREFMAEEQRIIATGEPIINRVEYNPARAQARWLAATKVPIRDASGNIIGTLGISRDITEQRLAEEREQRWRATLEKIIRLGKFVTEVQDVTVTLQRIWHSVREDLSFDRLGIYLFDAETDAMQGTYGTDNQGNMVDERHLVIHLKDPTVEAISFRKAIEKVNQVYVTHNYETEHHVQQGHIMQGVKDYAAIAAWAGDKPVAVLCVDNVISNRPISDDSLEALRLFAGYAGLAIENARLHSTLAIELEQQKQAEEREMQRRAILEKVVKLGKIVTEVTDLKTALTRIWHGVHDELGFDRLAIFLYDEKTHSINGTLGTDDFGNIVEEWDYARPIAPDKPTSFSRALAQPDGLYYTSQFAIDFDIPPGHEMHSVKDFAAVTAWGGNKPVAIITVDNLPSNRPFAADQLEALRLFAGYAGLAIENARLKTALEDDLTHRTELIEELEVKNAELERFTYTVSHDLKSPLVTITGFLGFLEQDALRGNKDNVKRTINRLTRAALKMQDLLNDLLELSRVGRLMNTPTDTPFQNIVHEAVDRVRGKLDEINALVEIHSNLPVVHGDQIRLVEVVQNLIENAAKYHTHKLQPRIEIGLGKLDQPMSTFFVRDNGIGIAPEYHERIFGLFNKLDPNAEGTGIGLTLVKRIIEVHGGQIWVESQPGKGTTFHFTLPTTPPKE